MTWASNLLKFILLAILFIQSPAYSRIKHTKSKTMPAALIYDASSRKVLYAHNINRKIHPASLTKMMTVYIAFERLQQGKLSLEDEITVSNHAANAKPCKLGLEAGETITVKEAILATIIKSANDAARAIAEEIGGSERKFAYIMNRKAKALGMRNTVFRNASGWHDPRQTTTAVDLLKLAIALKRDFPEYYPMFRLTSFMFKNKEYQGHNHVVKNYVGAEGMKTGYISASGYNLVTAAKRGNRRLIGVIIGGKTAKERDGRMITLLNKYFSTSNKTFIKSVKSKPKSKKIITSVATLKVDKIA
ncbi:D-alanyl-D-alanine serine-type carboxypeptidase [Candidatus Phycorickettsia trachydisci]|uniref:D-alanyl-D-alanine serine-type carboxypeptidase n=1 Tax=Candidatus Phycorickettsia trachydisci TaxID=2115978 RepID=A0A2P1P7N7_9RICK|nr:D-alanyl-D-alanine carboxypeptidase family protein [Candidatus Phycorickettsia trachydisci]AVP87287.1 D-alanyl-D-alanine serine-type carboxypeptidase [Candidatus Phycorickettsia trachydisci]